MHQNAWFFQKTPHENAQHDARVLKHGMLSYQGKQGFCKRKAPFAEWNMLVLNSVRKKTSQL